MDVGCGIGGPLREIASFRCDPWSLQPWTLCLFPSPLKLPPLSPFCCCHCSFFFQKWRVSDGIEQQRLPNFKRRSFEQESRPRHHLQLHKGRFHEYSGASKLIRCCLCYWSHLSCPRSSEFSPYLSSLPCAVHSDLFGTVQVGCYKEIKKVLKPGQLFAAYEWCMTEAYNPENKEHRVIKEKIELGNGLPDVRTTRQCLDALKEAGFEVLEEVDLARTSPISWFLPLDPYHLSLSSFKCSLVGRTLTRTMVLSKSFSLPLFWIQIERFNAQVWLLELVRLAPAGSYRVARFLEEGADGLVDGGRWVDGVTKTWILPDLWLANCIPFFKQEGVVYPHVLLPGEEAPHRLIWI